MGVSSVPEVDHYAVLGFPPGQDGSALSVEEIKKAYKNQSLKVHPDKCPDDPNANSAFQKLKVSFDFLMDRSSRSAYDALLLSRRNGKRRKRAPDLEEKERAAKRAAAAAKRAAASAAKRASAAATERSLRHVETVMADLFRNAIPGNGSNSSINIEFTFTTHTSFNF